MVLLPGDRPEDGAPGGGEAADRDRGPADPDVEQGITASFGVASFPEDAASREELLRKADRALYSAKRAGRNRVDTTADRRTTMSPARTANGAAPRPQTEPTPV